MRSFAALRTTAENAVDFKRQVMIAQTLQPK
jgi:hypothetical protein